MYFVISEELVDRDDLDIYEKMALVVLAKYANSSQKISKELLVQKMGADKTDFGYEYTDLAIKKLIKYGILSVFDDEDIEVLKLKDFSQESESESEEALDCVFEHEVQGAAQEGWNKSEKSRREEFGQFKQKKAQKLMEVIEDKSDEFSQESKYRIIDLSVRENMLELENKHGIPIEEIKAIFSEVCSNQKAKILFHLSEKNVEWIKIAYNLVKEEGAVDVLEVLAQFLQSNSFSDYLFQQKMKEEVALKNQREQRAKLELERKRALVQEKESKVEKEALSSSEEREALQLDAETKKRTAVSKNADLDFYNGYDLKSIFSNLEKKFEEGKVSHNAVHPESEKEDANKLNLRATSFKQAKTMYHSYGNSNVKKSDETKK